MNRREFLTGTAAAAGMGVTGFGQAPAPPPAAGRQGGRGGGGRGGPANVPAEKLARVEIMTLNHSSIIKLPWQDATPQRTLDIFDLPQYYVDVYGVRNVQFQSNHVAQNYDAPDMSYIRELKAKLDAAGCKAHQINIEIGTMAQIGPDGKAAALAGEARAAWLARAKKWVDLSPALGVTILMHNQGALTDDSKAGVTALWKELQDYATPKGIMISGETRGSGMPTAGNRGQGAPAPAPPAMSEKERLRYVWGILWECTVASGGYTNLDFGGDTRFHDQQELHDAIKGLLPRNSGGMHTRVSPTWDLGTAIKYAESIGYKGRYTIEVNEDPAVRIVYNTVLTNLP
ncbi:MAG: twin-arginine translocation signal domain-containing protein [Acidobacteria bacterium]|nr:twin-arginine translocation signal domain-containing protein [Acidobacteriota bacterium]